MGPLKFLAMMSFLADILPTPAYMKHMYNPQVNLNQINNNSFKPDINNDQYTVDFVFSTQLFRCIGKLAQCDGNVSTEEIEIVKKELQKMYPDDPEKRESLFEFFNSGRHTKLSFNELTDELAGRLDTYSNTAQYRSQAMSFFCKLALGDGQVQPIERRHLEYAARRLGTVARVRLEDFLQRQDSRQLTEKQRLKLRQRQ